MDWTRKRDHLWSNPNGGNWKDPTNAVAGPNQYPGKVAGDGADFSTVSAGPATYDLLLQNPLDSLRFQGWNDTLTVNFLLKVTSATGDFELTDASTINIAAGQWLWLLDAHTSGVNYWTNGTITGDATSHFIVTGCSLTIRGVQGGSSGPVGLGTEMDIAGDHTNGVGAGVNMILMRRNLTLTGGTNFNDVQDGGSLTLSQHIGTAGQENTQGGIELAGGHFGTLAVQLEGPSTQFSGGSLTRSDVPQAGVIDQVMIGGAVYNLGGSVQVNITNDKLKLTSQDGNGYSYWQKADSHASLSIGSGTNINAAGTCRIDTGSVVFNGFGDELDSAGLIFGNANPTSLTLSGGIATVTVQGPVTLGQQTTTSISYSGANNTSGVLDVRNGTLTLNGTLSLQCSDGVKPTRALVFFDDIGAGATIAGAFTSITDTRDPKANDTGQVVTINGTQKQFQVTFN